MNITSGIYSISTPYTYDNIDTMYVHIRKWNGKEFEDFIEDAPFIPGFPYSVIVDGALFYPRATNSKENLEIKSALNPEEYRHNYLDWQPSKLCIDYDEDE